MSRVVKKIKYEHSRAARRTFIDTFRIFALSSIEEVHVHISLTHVFLRVGQTETGETVEKVKYIH